MLVLTPGNTADCVMAEACVSLIPGVTELLADKGYDTDAFRAFLKDNNIKAIIPGKSNRKKRIRHDTEAYKGRNVVERCFCRIKAIVALVLLLPTPRSRSMPGYGSGSER